MSFRGIVGPEFGGELDRIFDIQAETYLTSTEDDHLCDHCRTAYTTERCDVCGRWTCGLCLDGDHLCGACAEAAEQAAEEEAERIALAAEIPGVPA